MQRSKKLSVGTVVVSVFMAVGCGPSAGGEGAPRLAADEEETETTTAHPLVSTSMRLTTRFAAGGEFSLQLQPDGTVWAYGSNQFGQLGAGITNSRSAWPVRTAVLTQVKAVTAGYFHALALKHDGSVWAWGLNNDGRLGDGSETDSNVPVQVYGLTYISAISTQSQHSMALRQDGTVWAWGSNDYGQLGDGTFFSSSLPVQVKNLSSVVAIAAGGTHSLALKMDGTVWAWGSNSEGQLGTSLVNSVPTPIQILGLSGVAALSTGYKHTLALMNDGTVRTWGYNGDGQLGDGTRTHRFSPTWVSGLTNVTTVAAGRDPFSVVSRADGSVWAWGYNGYGQLGDGTKTTRLTPTKVPGFYDAAAVSAGGYQTQALRQDGYVWGWGGSGSGELGAGSYSGSLTPVRAYLGPINVN